MRELGDRAAIDDTFPDEHVLDASQDLIHGSLILRITWVVIFSHRTCPLIKGKSLCMI